MRHGDHFGEIGAIFDTRRTMRVVSQKYSTLAQMTQTAFKELAFSEQDVEEGFKEAVFKYNDSTKRKLQKVLS